MDVLCFMLAGRMFHTAETRRGQRLEVEIFFFAQQVLY
jgi:hypothetical protein